MQINLYGLILVAFMTANLIRNLTNDKTSKLALQFEPNGKRLALRLLNLKLAVICLESAISSPLKYPFGSQLYDYRSIRNDTIHCFDLLGTED